MLRGKPTGQLGPSQSVDSAIGSYFVVKVPLDLPAFINALAPNLRMHFVGVKFVPIMGEIKIGEFMEPSKKETLHGNLRFRVVRGLAVCSAVTSLLFLISCPSAFAGGQHGFSIKVFTSTDDQFWTNSVIIEGTHEVMLVDAQFNKNQC
jgi:hypothetical protein